MVSLDGLGRTPDRARFDDIGIQGALYQPLDATFLLFNAMSFFVKNLDELVADDFSFSLGIGHSPELAQKALGSVYCDHLQPQLISQAALHLFELVPAQNAIVNKYAGQPGSARVIAQRAVHQSCSNRRVDAARESTDRAASADCPANAGDSFLNEALRRPVRFRTADVQHKVTQNVSSERGVMNFGMKLYRPHLALGIFDCRNRAGRLGGQAKPSRKFHRLVAMRHPHGQTLGNCLNKREPSCTSTLACPYSRFSAG